MIASMLTITIRYLFDFSQHEPVGEAIYLFFYFIPFVGLGIVRWHLPEFTDSIYIKQEMKYIMAILIIALVAFGLQEMAESYFDNIPNTQLIINIVFYVVIDLCNFCCVLITTRYVLQKVSILLSEQIRQAAVVENNDSVDHSSSHYVALNDDPNASNVSSTGQNLYDELIQCLSNEKTFDLFMRFLAREFRYCYHL